MSKKSEIKQLIAYTVDPTECPFREFRDTELTIDSWGMGPAALRASHVMSKIPVSKSHADLSWGDDQTQPLPRSVRQFLHGWIRAEDLAFSRWEAEVAVFEDASDIAKMNIIDMQLSHAQVILRSSFCRSVLSMCFILERVDNITVEHQWENFAFSLPPEGWRARYHIYSPGLKPGGGAQHRPVLSKNGCYLVRLYYLGAWRCVWVSDLVPIDATESPLLPFSPIFCHSPARPGAKMAAPAITAPIVHLWPLLICKALLKLAAPDMNSDEGADFEDESMPEFDILHALTGAMNLTYRITGDLVDPNNLWELVTSEVPVFSWDDDSDTMMSTIKSKSTKKPTTKETFSVRRNTITTILLEDTKTQPPYALPGITPGHQMTLLINMARDLPLKKPLPEPEVPQWKIYRWVDWARHHGLYEAFACPRTKFLKVNGFLKQSHAPHLLDVQSTESITFQFREDHDRTNPPGRKGGKELNRSGNIHSSNQQMKEELREWIEFDGIREYVKNVNILFFPSMYQYTTAASSPPVRITKAPPNKNLDIPAPKSAPLYLQIDGPDENILKISLAMLHPRVLFNCGIPVMDHIEPAYLFLEIFEWFVDCELPKAKSYIATRGYDCIEITLDPGRHFCRVWVHSRMNWTAMFLSDSTLVLGTRDVIQSAAVRECPWASRFLNNLSLAFSNWLRASRSSATLGYSDKEFYNSYQPDLVWDPKIVGYDKRLLHWMFRQALQALLIRKLLPNEYKAVCSTLRKFFHDPDFGLPPKPKPPTSLRDIAMMDPCDCVLPEAEELEITEQLEEEQQVEIAAAEERPIVDKETMDRLLSPPKFPITSNVCELATEEIPCGVLKEEREKVIRKHEAARVIQAHWRGAWARKCLQAPLAVPPEITKLLMDYVFGTLETLSALMNMFFGMYPGARYAYSVASALSGVYGLQQHSGNSPVTPKCKWIPYFQGVFYCHSPVKVHFDVQSTLQYRTFAVYNNDTGIQMPQAYNSHITFDFRPNEHGYTVMGHGTITEAPGTSSDVHWQLTVLTSLSDVFHVCDNDDTSCKDLPLPPASKLHVDEIFIPNRRNILGGIHLSVSKHEAISFRAAATSPELEMQAILKMKGPDGEIEEVDRCSGTGELYWPYIRLQPTPPSLLTSPAHKRSMSNSNAIDSKSIFPSDRPRSSRIPKQKPSSAGPKNRSSTKLKDSKSTVEPRQYTIEVIAPKGWPLTLQQWIRVDEVRNSQELTKIDTTPKKTGKEKPGSGKEREKSPIPQRQPQPGDAYVELECSLSIGGGATARRDDERDQLFVAARKAWDAKDHGRNTRGAHIRKEFRAEFLEALPPPPSESTMSMKEEHYLEEVEGEQKKETEATQQQGPTPVTDSAELEVEEESEEESLYLTMPDQLKDKFIPLYFVPFCTKVEIEEEKILLTPEIAHVTQKIRQQKLEAALDRMNELQYYNKVHVLGRQKKRGRLLERLFVDSQWSPDLEEVLEERDDAIAQEALNRTLSANKKKLDAKKK
ncbi:androglobin-like [Pieris napi]|uniref:androglobin-like n=1 Tax=Pieris napi TaxID=78633 RepID=UPI001FBA8BFF|nr:androglobin-like [Pieris napi]